MELSSTDPKDSSPETGADFPPSSRDRLADKINHLLRNKLQAINGGQFLLEAGIKRNDWELVGTGWKAVKKNQVDLIRCSNHLMVLHRLEFLEPDPTQLDELLFASVQEFESLFCKSNINVIVGKSSQSFLLDPFVIRSTLIGLIRIASHSESETPKSVDVQLQHPGAVIIKIRFHSEGSFDDPRETNSSLSIEWKMAEKVVSSLGGTLHWHQMGAESCLALELPENKMG